MQWRARADDMHDAYRGAAARCAFDIDDLVALANAEVHTFAGGLVQLLHLRHGAVADADARLDDVAEFQKADAQSIGTGVAFLDEAARCHRAQNAMRSRRMQFAFMGQ